MLPLAGPSYITNTRFLSRCWWTSSSNWPGLDSDDPGRCFADVPEDPEHVGLCEKHLRELREETA